MSTTSRSRDSSSAHSKMPRHFTTTRWSLVTGAATGNDAQALETLCRHYREPILSFIQHSGQPLQNAQDLTQQFFLYILNNNTLTHAKAQRGKFRTFLLSCLKNFLINEHKHQNRLKRGGGYKMVSLDNDDYPSELPDTEQLSPEHHYDKRWAETVVENTLQLLEAEWKRDDKPFDQLKGYLINSEPNLPFSHQAEIMGVSEAALKSAVHRMRQRYGQLVRDEVTATVNDPTELADELRHLLNMLASS